MLCMCISKTHKTHAFLRVCRVRFWAQTLCLNPIERTQSLRSTDRKFRAYDWYVDTLDCAMLKPYPDTVGLKYRAYVIFKITRMVFGEAIQFIKALSGSFLGHMFYKTCNERTSLITIVVSQNRIVLLCV